MNKKTYLLLIILTFLISCSKKTTELEIKTVNKSTEKEEQTVDSSNEETRPLTYIGEEDTLKIWVRADGAPYMYLNDKGELKGLCVDLERKIMEEMGQKYELIPYMDLGPLVQKIKSGEAHLAVATPNLPDYRTFLNMSNSYETLEFVTFIHEDSELDDITSKDGIIKSFFGKKIGVQTRAHIYQLLRDYKEIEIVEYPTTTSALEALNRKEVDAVPDVKRIGVLYTKTNNWDIVPVGEALFSLELCTSFSKTLDTSIVEKYNSALRVLTDSGEIDKLYSSYFGDNEEI